MTLKRSPSRSAITNLSENHLDWHIDKKEYVEAKANIYTYHDCKRLVTEFSAYNLLKELHKPIPRECILIGENQDVYSDGKDICIFGKKTVPVSDIVLKGEHNLKNFMTAVAISYPDITKEALIKTARNFRGIAHRIEFVDTKHGISFFNSSIDSTPSRTLNTLKCFGSNITLICGGYDKNLDYSELAEYVNNHIKNLVLYGDAAEKIYSYFQKSGSAKVNITKTDSFDSAFKNAAEMTKKGETVLLSPACASFDQFKDFQERGDRFSELVRSLI
jgi:UDP-N-acetylmuramoylalanine--D-glutamate ligase